MAHWWASKPNERYWCEITFRPDIGWDLKCPQTDEGGKSNPTYDLIRYIRPGDIVFHYSTRNRAFVGASVAGGPLENRPIKWVPHGAVRGAKRRRNRPPDATRPGWWLPLFGYRTVAEPLTMAVLNEPENQDWIVKWITARRTDGALAAPVQLYGKTTGRLEIRGAQAYLAKFPLDFVERWLTLRSLADSLLGRQEELDAINEVLAARDGPLTGTFRPRAMPTTSPSSRGVSNIARGAMSASSVWPGRFCKRSAPRSRPLIRLTF
jgi:hypothetical protein